MSENFRSNGAKKIAGDEHICALKNPPPIKKRLIAIYDALLNHFGYRHWWPGDSPFEIIVGAILTQNTAWKNVEKAIDNLKRKKLLSPKRMQQVETELLAELIRPAGYYNQKARKLKAFLNVLFENYCGSLDELFKLDTPKLRSELLSIWGIGEETADSIILYAAFKPTFVVDAYTKRILTRKGIVDNDAKYADIKQLFESNLERNIKLFNDYHAQFVALGKNICQKVPICGKCPIRSL